MSAKDNAYFEGVGLRQEIVEQAGNVPIAIHYPEIVLLPRVYSGTETIEYDGQSELLEETYSYSYHYWAYASIGEGVSLYITFNDEVTANITELRNNYRVLQEVNPEGQAAPNYYLDTTRTSIYTNTTYPAGYFWTELPVCKLRIGATDYTLDTKEEINIEGNVSDESLNSCTIVRSYDGYLNANSGIFIGYRYDNTWCFSTRATGWTTIETFTSYWDKVGGGLDIDNTTRNKYSTNIVGEAHNNLSEQISIPNRVFGYLKLVYDSVNNRDAVEFRHVTIPQYVLGEEVWDDFDVNNPDYQVAKFISSATLQYESDILFSIHAVYTGDNTNREFPRAIIFPLDHATGFVYSMLSDGSHSVNVRLEAGEVCIYITFTPDSLTVNDRNQACQVVSMKFKYNEQTGYIVYDSILEGTIPLDSANYTYSSVYCQPVIPQPVAHAHNVS